MRGYTIKRIIRIVVCGICIPIIIVFWSIKHHKYLPVDTGIYDDQIDSNTTFSTEKPLKDSEAGNIAGFVYGHPPQRRTS